MQLRWRKLVKRETDWELVLGVLWTPLFLLTVWAAMWLPPRWIPACRFHRITGLACPTCGAYRCAGLLLSGHRREAFVTQPLAVIVVALLLVYSLYAMVVVFGRLRRLRLDGVSGRQRVAIWALLCAAVLLNWGYLVAAGR